jgi:hypothetical protein
MLNHSLSTPILSLQKGGQFAAILRGQFVRLFQIKAKHKNSFRNFQSITHLPLLQWQF